MGGRGRPKRYWIAVKGHDGRQVVATSPGAARWAEYRAWREAGFARSWPNTISFGDFLKGQIETFYHLGAALAAQPDHTQPGIANGDGPSPSPNPGNGDYA